MIVSGIDPGESGAMCVLWPNAVGSFAPEFWDYKRYSMLSGLIHYIPAADDNNMVFIENVHSMPGQGVSSTFKFGKNFGWWLGVLETLGINYALVTPQKWKKHFGLIKQPKGTSLELARELFPQVADQLSLKKHHNRADALLIAKYGWDILKKGMN